ncbi:heat shock 70 kDa protein-like [Paramacrobiotus metropolitanus]|uniref:heat shock 70 kDa protein-like n=1 Tax=Paramacrobiotus metropolitanus TaxID=2943436 RepID=UPI002445CBB5|nr:heat shock 70 kDa protein-like [Paramacrobiotus metropolitanus]
MAGIEKVRLLDEPIAAVIPYIRSFSRGKRFVLVLDFDSQQLAVSIVKVDISGAQLTRIGLHSSLFTSFLGEKCIDERIFEHLFGIIQDVYSVKLTGNRTAERCLASACKQINGDDRHIIEIPRLLGGNAFSMSVSQSMLKSLCIDLFHKIVTPIEKVLVKASLTASDVVDVVMVGCGRFVPQITDVLTEFFPIVKIHAAVDPTIAIAEGAALLASNLLDRTGERIEINQRLPYTLTAHVSGSAPIPVIKKWSRLPVENQIVFTASVGNQRFIDIDVFEGENSIKNFLSTYKFFNITPFTESLPLLTAHFTIDADKVLTVTAADGEGEERPVFRSDSLNFLDRGWEMFDEQRAKEAKDALEKALDSAQHYVAYDDHTRGVRLQTLSSWFYRTRDSVQPVKIMTDGLVCCKLFWHDIVGYKK